MYESRWMVLEPEIRLPRDEEEEAVFINISKWPLAKDSWNPFHELRLLLIYHTWMVWLSHSRLSNINGGGLYIGNPTKQSVPSNQDHINRM